MRVTSQPVIIPLGSPLHDLYPPKRKKKGGREGKGGHKDVPRTKRSGTDSDKQFESTLKGNLVRVGVKGRESRNEMLVSMVLEKS